MALLIGVLVCGCTSTEPQCVENAGALVADERLPITVADARYTAEVVRTPSDRERGWARRACGREALLLIPDAREALPVWGCHLAEGVRVGLIRDETLVEVGVLQPCAPPCTACPIVGERVPVDAVLELPLDAPALSVGDQVGGVRALEIR